MLSNQKRSNLRGLSGAGVRAAECSLEKERRTMNTSQNWMVRAAWVFAVSATPACDKGLACHSESGCVSPEGGNGSHHEGVTGGGGAAEAGEFTAENYCTCMLVSCHDKFHSKWGEADGDAAAACIANANAVPKRGMETETGNFLECRMHFCGIGDENDTACEKAAGEATCL